MTDKPGQPKGQNGVLSSLNMAIDGLNFAKEISSVTPAKAVFGSVVILLTMIRDSMANDADYVELGLYCADICRALERGVDRKKLNELSKSVCDGINHLTTTVAEIQNKVIKRSERHRVSRLFHARNDKEMIASWKSDLDRLLRIFNTEVAVNTHTIVADVHQNMLKTRDDAGSQNRATQNSAPGELPPLPPRAFFGRDDLIERIIGFAKNLTPIALIGAGGIGKTSIALTTLHDDRVKQRFGDNRWFIRCDGFPASRTHFLRRLSEVIGANVENPEDLTPLRRYLSSKEMMIVLDNAESVLDLQGSSEQDIYAIVDELTRFDNIFLCVTSRISTLPPDIEAIEIPTLPTNAARETFYRIYKRDEQSESINNILEQLDCHPLSITLLATTAQHNKWDANRLTREWGRERTGALRAKNTRSLAATIELSLTSPMFLELGPDARQFLGVIAFFPQGVNESNTDWLFPTIPNSSDMLDKFCILSLTHRANGITTMLAPLRDYLRPKDPTSCSLLCATKDRYFARLLPYLSPDGPRFEDSRWITSEDANVEHLLDVFASIDPNSEEVWDACVKFMTHLYWHKRRPVMLGPKIEALPDDHPSKPRCMRYLSWLSGSVGNFAESKRILTQALKLWRERGDDHRVALTLSDLSDVNRRIGCFEEGVQQAREASEMFGRAGDTAEQAKCLIDLAWLLHEDKQLDAAEGAASRAIDLLPREGQQLAFCDCHRVLGSIYDAKGEAEKAIRHLELALKIATSLNTSYDLFWLYFALAQLFSGQGKFDDTRSHIERAKSHAIGDTYLLARASLLQAQLLAKEDKFEEAKSEASQVVGVFEKLGAATDAECTVNFLRRIEAINVSE